MNMRGTEKYSALQAGNQGRITKDILNNRGQSENINTQTSANSLNYNHAARKITNVRDTATKRKMDENSTEISSKKRPDAPEQQEPIDLTTKESRAKFQEEVNAAMPQLAVANNNDDRENDIDLADEFDPSLLGLYAKEIFAYLTVVEKYSGFPLNKISNTLPAKHVEFVQEGPGSKNASVPTSGSVEYGINAYTRAKVIDFISSVHQKLGMCNESIFLAVQFLDRVNYLEGALGKTDITSKNLLKYRQQKRLIDNPYLLGLTCLFIANKYEDRYTPGSKNLVRCANNKFMVQDVIDCERRVLRLLDYALHCPTPIVFLRRFCRIDDTQTRERYMCFLVGEMCFRSPVISSLRPSLVAAAILGYVNQLTKKPIWTDKLTMYSNIKEEDIKPIIKNIEHFVKDYDRSFYGSVKSKYIAPRYHGAWEAFVELV